MGQEMEKNNVSNIISTADLGEGRKQVTFSVNASSLKEYLDMFPNAENIQVDNYKIGKGSVLNRYDVTKNSYYGSGFTSNDYPYTQVYANLPTDPHRKIKLAVELYFKEPIVGSVVDTMVDFSSSGFTNECDDAEIKKIYDKWCEEININDLLEKIFLEYYRSGNVTIYRSTDKAKVRKRRRAKGDSKEIDITEYSFPSAYSVLNPMNVYINGNLMFGKEEVMLKLANEMTQMLASPESPSNYLADIPEVLRKKIRQTQNGVFLPLENELVSRITRKKMDYERYASPFLERVFEPVMYKAKLRMMDMSTIEGLVNQLVTVTVGDKEFPATDEDLKAIAELFQTPNKAYTVFWNHTLKVTFHKPEGIDTLTSEKYKQVNEDIIAGLGISRTVVDGGGQGGGAGFSSAWISILSLIERLDNARGKVKHWLEQEYKMVAEENNFKTYPRVRFNNMNLREDTYIRDVLLAMYDRGLLDEEDILTETGRDYQSVVDMKKRNDKNKDLFLPPEQPFQGGKTGPNNPNGTGSPGGRQKVQRKQNPESNSGKTPKVRKATASYDSEEEDYANELISQYDFIQSEVMSILDSNKNEDDRVKKVLVASTIMSLFKSLSYIGYRYIDSVFDNEVSQFDITPNGTSAGLMKRELKGWNDSYVSKLANDINDTITQAISGGASVPDAVEGAFKANKYRVGLMSQAGVLESVRQAQIIGNELVGSTTATWVAHIDDRTCATCHGLHGRQFALADIPPRPHSGCRCSLEFN
jgi:hypothetical protein